MGDILNSLGQHMDKGEQEKSLHFSDFLHNPQGIRVLERKLSTPPGEGKGGVKIDWSESPFLPC